MLAKRLSVYQEGHCCVELVVDVGLLDCGVAVHWYLPTSPHGFTTQKSNIDIFTAVRTSNLIQRNHNSEDNIRHFPRDCVQMGEDQVHMMDVKNRLEPR
jgi:hypothetical protein